MKHLIYFLPIFLFTACNSWQSEEESAENETSNTVKGTDTVYLVRNSQISPANSYSDLFLDSSIVEQFIQQKQMSGEDAQKIRSFYNYRNGQFAWFNTNGFSEQARGFWNLRDAFETNTADTAIRKRMDTLLNTDTLNITRFDTSIGKTELELTHAFLQFHKTNRDKIQFANLSAEKLIPVKKENELTLADTLLRRQSNPTSHSAGNSQYFLLSQKLKQYDSFARSGGWQPLVLRANQLKKNISSADVVLLKKRLQLTGDYHGADTSRTFNDSLEIAIKNYQKRNGLDTTGRVSDTLVGSLNVPVEQRIRQLIINMNRAQWMLPEDDPDYIRVNIPDFMLTVFEKGRKVFDMPVVVGKEGTNTMMFSGDLNQIVFSPYWNIPPSIVKKEILPAMMFDPTYLKRNKMEIVRQNDSLPVIRQLPGDHNSLGEVKFLFPNRYDIYFHDTKSKDIFQLNKRADSHGCIRLADAEKMSNYLLRNTSGWTPAKVQTAMNSGKEQNVKINKPVSVSITYLTAWVDEAGSLHFRDDIYGHDNRIAPMLFDLKGQSTLNNSGDSLPGPVTRKG